MNGSTRSCSPSLVVVTLLGIILVLLPLGTEGLGRLRVTVRYDLQRTWSRELRIERHNKGLSAIAPRLSGKYASMGSKH